MHNTAKKIETNEEKDIKDLETACAKKSFLKLPVTIDTIKLLNEFKKIPDTAWGVSHWDVHCSINALLLRGGNKGTDEDFTTNEVTDAPILKKLPYISSLLAQDGPFGGASYAFLFSTKPNGITRVHDDGHEVWKKTVRIHVPIITNDGAFLLAEERAKHLSVGEVWTFDNQSDHSVVNGDSARVHLIFDVNPNPKLADLMNDAIFDPGIHDPKRWELTLGPRRNNRKPPLMFAVGEPLTPSEKKSMKLNLNGFATRIVRLGKKGTLLRTPLKSGDIVTAVNNVEESTLSRTALDHVRLKHEAGENVTLDVIRHSEKIHVAINLKPDHYFSPSIRFMNFIKRLGFSTEQKIKNEY